MRDVNMEDFQPETASSSLPFQEKKPPHHLPPSTVSRIRQVGHDRVEHQSENNLALEDFTAQDFKRYGGNDLKEGRSHAPAADTSPDVLPVNSEKPPVRSRNRMLIPLDFVHENIVVRQAILTGWDVFDITLGFKTCDSFEFEEQDDSKLFDSSQDPILVDKVIKHTICDSCEFQNLESNFRVSSDMEFHQSSVCFKISPELDINSGSSKFRLHDGLNWRVPRKVKVVGNTECSRSANRPTFSIPTTKNVDLKNHSKFSLPKQPSSDKGIKSSGKFSIPDYSKYKNSEVNRSKNRRFHINPEGKTFKDKPRFSIPKGPSLGWGFTFISIPKTPSGTRKTYAKSSIFKDAQYIPDAKPVFAIPSLDEDEEKQAAKFFLSESGTLSNIERQFTMSDGLEVVTLKPSIHRDFTENSKLVNGVKYVYADSCTLENINLSYTFNELDIDCSQISLESEPI